MGMAEVRSSNRWMEFLPFEILFCVDAVAEVSGKNLVNSSSKSGWQLKRAATWNIKGGRERNEERERER